MEFIVLMFFALLVIAALAAFVPIVINMWLDLIDYLKWRNYRREE